MDYFDRLFRANFTFRGMGTNSHVGNTLGLQTHFILEEAKTTLTRHSGSRVWFWRGQDLLRNFLIAILISRMFTLAAFADDMRDAIKYAGCY